ncbi:MAG TPA: hypothetical protein VFV48_08020 [Pseudomonadales bacterium]|nr:hypothetical protein [Pseudomonadales bacterium]
MRKLTASLICVVLLCSGCGSDDRGLTETPEPAPTPLPYRIDSQFAPPTALERPPANGVLPDSLKPPKVS